MRVSRRWMLVTLAAVLTLGAALPLANLHAQTSTVTISLGVPQGLKDTINDKMLKDFEDANPGIKVNLVDAVQTPDPANGLDAYLTALQKYASAADVMYAFPPIVSPQGTQAGYFLDLAPLTSTDNSLNVSDFYPAAWQAYQWDHGVWALPTSLEVGVLVYDPAAFDKAGVAYPSEKWTLDDFVNAVNKLSLKDANGKVTTPALAQSNGIILQSVLRSLIGDNLFDASTVPNAPQLSKPTVETVLDAWSKLDQQGMVNGPLQSSPMSLAPVQLMSIAPTKRNGVLLPGGKAILFADAFAVSAGTQYPEQAYALVKYLTTRGEFAGGTAIPARKSLAGFTPSGPRFKITPEEQTLVDQGLANALTPADLRYSDYLQTALNNMKSQNLTAQAALQAIESQAVSDVKAAADKKSKLALTVATPIPEAPLAAGKMALTFDVTAFISPLPTKDAWDKLIADFTASDPQVGQVKLVVGRDTVAQAADKSDCFYLPVNSVPEADVSKLMNIDPFISADAKFDKADLLGNTLTAVQRDNKTWALPITLSPMLLNYDSTQFAKLNVPTPTGGWTINAFQDALKALKTDPKGASPFVDTNTNGTYLLALMAAYGGLPLDFRTSPPTIHFTDPATVDAMRQTLDLAKNGYIQYGALGNLIGGSGVRPDKTTMIYPISLNAFSRGAGPSIDNGDTYKPVLFPKGTKYTGLPYNIGTAYISAKAQSPEACYRFIGEIAAHPELFSAMPARHSELNNPTFAASVNPDTLALYSQVDAALKDPNTVPFPVPNPLNGTPSTFLFTHWLYEAFDSYVLNSGDLESALKTAEGYATGYQGCTANLPDISTASLGDDPTTVKPYVDCAEKVDARLKPILDPLVGR